jgi:hypothetical protein
LSRRRVSLVILESQVVFSEDEKELCGMKTKIL